MMVVRNPPTTVAVARTLKVSPSCIQKILKDNLALVRRKQIKTHSLTEKQAKQRHDRGNGFLQHLTPRKLRYVLTFDETFITLDETNGETDFYYDGVHLEIPEDWKKKPRKAWPRKVIVVMGICWKGKTKAYIVPEKADY